MSDVVPCPKCGKKNRVPATAGGVPQCAACHSPLPWLTDAGDGDFDRVAGESPVPVLVDLWAPWCPPCRAVAPAVEAAARKLAGRLKVVKVNVDQAPAVAARFEARSIPMLLILDKGQLRQRQVGAVPPDQLLRWAENALAQD
ncbi:MAG TPA: thioredoxin domain-containing protein [Acidimicrobiales bacterium]|nr:thioredoxin domain-containing protein [Acidimicrobiales bacterium]